MEVDLIDFSVTVKAATLKFISGRGSAISEGKSGVVCATSKGSDQPVHTRSLIRAFANRLDIL